MNEQKLKRLFQAARNDAAPVPPADFAAEVLRAVHREPACAPRSSSLFEQLNILFPRVALAAAAIIVASVAADFALTALGLPDFSDGATQAVSHVIFDTEEL